MGRSYAHDLTARYGISFDKTVTTLSERQIIDPDLAGTVSS